MHLLEPPIKIQTTLSIPQKGALTTLSLHCSPMRKEKVMKTIQTEKKNLIQLKSNKMLISTFQMFKL